MKLELRCVTVESPGARDARRSWPVRERLLLRLSDAHGAFGVGEASPLPGYSRDALGDVEAALRGLARQLAVGSWQLAVGESAEPMDTLRRVGMLVAGDVPAARMGLETAALDLLSRKAGLSAARWLGAPDDAAVRLAALIGPAAEPGLLERARGAVEQGYEHLKIKVGAAGRCREEVAAIVGVRQALDASVSLRLDANGAWSEGELLDAWQTLRGCGLELFEEPGALPEGLLRELPLALDESLQGLTAGEVSSALERSQARAVVLKPTELGGLAHCLELAQLARAASVGVVWSHCFEGALAWRAAAAAALAQPGGVAHGLAPHAGLTSDEASSLVRAGTLHTWSEPGLGQPGAFE